MLLLQVGRGSKNMLLVSYSRLYVSRICYWSVTLGFMHQEYVSGQLLSTLCIKNMSGQLHSALCTKNMFLVSCSRNVLLTFLVDISDKREIKPCTNIHILDKIDPANIVSLIVLPINASV